jgi:hypothetical protein
MIEIFHHIAGFERFPPEYNNLSQKYNYGMKPKRLYVSMVVLAENMKQIAHTRLKQHSHE